jgi:hypothetical protein
MKPTIRRPTEVEQDKEEVGSVPILRVGSSRITISFSRRGGHFGFWWFEVSPVRPPAELHRSAGERRFRMSALEQRVIPALRITQYARSKAFYLERLGFELEWEHRFEPHFPVFMSVVRDGMRLYLSEHMV